MIGARSRFRTKLLIVFGGLIALVQCATLLGVLDVARDESARRTAAELRVGAAVLRADLAQREADLVHRVRLLSREGDLLDAIATRDPAILAAALDAHVGPVGARSVLLLDPSGAAVAASRGPDADRALPHAAELLEEARDAGAAARPLVADGSLLLAVLAPVRTPQLVGWIYMVFPIDEHVARAVRAKTLLDVSVFAVDGRSNVLPLVSTLAAGERDRVAQAIGGSLTSGPPSGEPLIVGETEQVTVAVPLLGARLAADGTSTYAVLQTSADVMLGFRRLQSAAIALMIAALAVATGVVAWISRSIARPVQELVAAAQRISTGDYAEAVTVDTRDEMRLLADAMNEMQREISLREAQIRYQASHDPLTGLFSRSVVHERVAEALARAEQAGEGVAVLILSIDRFKEINDTFGHGTGDRVLQVVAERLRAEPETYHAAIRLGGDEFLLIVEGADETQARAAGGALLDALSGTIEIDGIEIGLTVCIGISLYPDHGDDSGALLRRADNATLCAKRAGRRVAVYQPGEDEHHLHRLALVNDLRGAIARGELRLYVQPKVDARTRDVRQVEVLLRWDSPRHGHVAPDAFIALAEESGQIRKLTRFVIETAIDQCGAWRRRGLHVAVAVNLSALDLSETSLVDFVTECLAMHALPASSLVVEVTETAMMNDLDTAIDVLRRLADGGVQVALDDFGTGHSSLAHLRRMPARELKIDKSFVSALKSSPEDACIVRAAAEIGHGLGMLVVAEGVEDEESFQRVLDLGCDLVQGYVITSPIPAEDFETWVADYYAAEVPPTKP